jgi:hypothetical protein
MESNRIRRYKFRNKKKKIYMDRLHIKKIRWRYQRLPYFGTPRETGREVDHETAGEDR